MLKSRLAGFICTVVFASYAAAQGLPPEKCPSISEIKGEGLSYVTEFGSHKYLASQISHYDTEQQWIFAIAFIPAKNQEIALEKGNKLMNDVSGSPFPQEDHNEWVCEYNIPGNYMAVALPVDFLSMQRVKQYFAK